MIIVLGVLVALCAVMMWGAEKRDRPLRRADREAARLNQTQPAE